MSDTPTDEAATPNLSFEGSTPYEDYVQASVLTHLQHPLSNEPGEMAFLVTTQVMELWFTLLVHEWTTAARALRQDDLATAMAALHRSLPELESLNASWKPIAHLTPGQFNAYRSALGEGSGFQSAMYRRLEFLLGDKSASMLVPHRGTPSAHAELEKVWDAWGVRPETDPNDPEEIEHNAEIFAIDPQGQIRALYPPNFKPAKLAIGTRTLAQL